MALPSICQPCKTVLLAFKGGLIVKHVKLTSQLSKAYHPRVNSFVNTVTAVLPSLFSFIIVQVSSTLSQKLKVDSKSRTLIISKIVSPIANISESCADSSFLQFFLQLPTPIEIHGLCSTGQSGRRINRRVKYGRMDVLQAYYLALSKTSAFNGAYIAHSNEGYSLREPPVTGKGKSPSHPPMNSPLMKTWGTV